MSRTVTLVGFAVIALGGLGLEIAGRRGRGTTFTGFVRCAARGWPVRLLLIAGWLWLGWHVFVRVDWQ